MPEFDINRNNSFIHVHRQLYLSLFDPARSSIVALHELNNNFLIVPYNLSCKTNFGQQADIVDQGPVSLAEIYNFDCVMRAVARQNPDSKLVVCAGLLPAVRARTALLLGCHMLLSRGISLKRTVRAFSPLHDLPDCPILANGIPDPHFKDDSVWEEELTAASCWGSLAAALRNRWIDFGRTLTAACDEDDGALCVEEYLHYAE